jgi:hypothetical protein
MPEELYQLPRKVAERRRRLVLYLALLGVGALVAAIEATGFRFGREFGHPLELGALGSWSSRLLWVSLGSIGFLGLGFGELWEERLAQVLALSLAGLSWIWGLVAPVYSPAVLALAVRKLVGLGVFRQEPRGRRRGIPPIPGRRARPGVRAAGRRKDHVRRRADSTRPSRSTGGAGREARDLPAHERFPQAGSQLPRPVLGAKWAGRL